MGVHASTVIGVAAREWRSRVAGYDHPHVAAYFAGSGITPGPYCIAFISWVFRQAGATHEEFPFSPNPSHLKTILIPNLGSLLAHTSQLRAGDIWAISRKGPSGVYSHGGIIYDNPSGDDVHTIEGNTEHPNAPRRCVAPRLRSRLFLSDVWLIRPHCVYNPF